MIVFLLWKIESFEKILNPSCESGSTRPQIHLFLLKVTLLMSNIPRDQFANLVDHEPSPLSFNQFNANRLACKDPRLLAVSFMPSFHGLRSYRLQMDILTQTITGQGIFD